MISHCFKITCQRNIEKITFTAYTNGANNKNHKFISVRTCPKLDQSNPIVAQINRNAEPRILAIFKRGLYFCGAIGLLSKINSYDKVYMIPVNLRIAIFIFFQDGSYRLCRNSTSNPIIRYIPGYDSSCGNNRVFTNRDSAQNN